MEHAQYPKVNSCSFSLFAWVLLYHLLVIFTFQYNLPQTFRWFIRPSFSLRPILSNSLGSPVWADCSEASNACSSGTSTSSLELLSLSPSLHFLFPGSCISLFSVQFPDLHFSKLSQGNLMVQDQRHSDSSFQCVCCLSFVALVCIGCPWCLDTVVWDVALHHPRTHFIPCLCWSTWFLYLSFSLLLQFHGLVEHIF